MTKNVESKLDFLLNSKLVGTKPGIGSLNYIILLSEDQVEYALWLYMADWAFTSKGEEIASSDIFNIGRTLDLSKYYGQTLTSIYEFPSGDEIHFEFSGKLCLEIWENTEAYGAENREFFSVFCEQPSPKHILTYPIKMG